LITQHFQQRSAAIIARVEKLLQEPYNRGFLLTLTQLHKRLLTAFSKVNANTTATNTTTTNTSTTTTTTSGASQ
jgi:hypothetical protein